MTGHIRIAELPPADPPDGTEVVPLVQAGVTKRLPVSSFGHGTVSLGQTGQLAYYYGSGTAVRGLALGIGFTISNDTLNFVGTIGGVPGGGGGGGAVDLTHALLDDLGNLLFEDTATTADLSHAALDDFGSIMADDLGGDLARAALDDL
jgi:hypothetical protein